MKVSVQVMLLVCLALGARQLQAARIKIQLERDSAAKYSTHLFKRQANGGSCTDNVEVSRSSLTLPGRLDELDPRVTFYQSPIATDNLNAFQDVLVAGLERLTVGNVLTVLRNEGCPTFFFGGAVRDQYLNRQPNDADVEIDCTIETFFNVCITAWGQSNCGRSPTRPLGHVGNKAVQPDKEEVDVASTDITFYAPLADLEYTVNSMAYDTNGNDIIIDLSGTGQTDACERHIRIPSDDNTVESWNMWVDKSKAFRFWKLRVKGLTAFNRATQEFIVNSVKGFIEGDVNSFPKFYCRTVYEASYNMADKKCDIPEANCEKYNGNAVLYNQSFAEDFGSYWNDYILQNVFPSLADCSSANPLEYSMKLVTGLSLATFIVLFF